MINVDNCWSLLSYGTPSYSPDVKTNTCIDSFNILCTVGPPSRIQGGMRDIGLHFGGWVFGVPDDPSDDASDEHVREDSGAESEGTEFLIPFTDRFPSSQDKAVTIAEDGVVSVSVGLPRRFGNPVCDEDAEPESVAALDPDQISFREILRKVTVNETTLHLAIDILGGGVQGLKAVVDFVKHFQETKEREAGVTHPDEFTRGLEEFCRQNGPGKPGVEEVANSEVANPEVANAEMSEVETRVTEVEQRLPNVHMGGHAANNDPFAVMGGYMESMSGFYPNFCYPYPPPFHAGYNPFNMGVRPMYVPMMGVPYYPQPSQHEFVPRTTDAITRASRKSRIARRRGQGTEAYPMRPATKHVHVGGGSVTAGQQENMSYQSHAVSSFGQVAQGLNSRDLILVLRKQLSPSGVSSLGRIVLPKKEAETHLPQLDASEGLLLTMTDYDTSQNWTFRYRFWSNNKSRMYLLENTRDFVKAHNLQERDMLTLYRDAHGSYVVRGEKSNSNQTGDTANDTAGDDLPTEEDLPHKKQKF